jgi:hypothetical protein
MHGKYCQIRAVPACYNSKILLLAFLWWTDQLKKGQQRLHLHARISRRRRPTSGTKIKREEESILVCTSCRMRRWHVQFGTWMLLLANGQWRRQARKTSPTASGVLLDFGQGAAMAWHGCWLGAYQTAESQFANEMVPSMRSHIVPKIIIKIYDWSTGLQGL